MEVKGPTIEVGFGIISEQILHNKMSPEHNEDCNKSGCIAAPNDIKNTREFIELSALGEISLAIIVESEKTFRIDYQWEGK